MFISDLNLFPIIYFYIHCTFYIHVFGLQPVHKTGLQDLCIMDNKITLSKILYTCG